MHAKSKYNILIKITNYMLLLIRFWKQNKEKKFYPLHFFYLSEGRVQIYIIFLTGSVFFTFSNRKVNYVISIWTDRLNEWFK
jgi:hypothetical protein